MKSYDFNTVIVGGGCMGVSILHELMRRGARNVALVDCGRKTVSATAHSGGMIRVFHESADHVGLALGNYAAVSVYRNEGVLTEQAEPNGSLYFFDRNRLAGYEANLKIMSDAGYPFEVLTTNQGRERFPGFEWRQDEWAIYEPLGSAMTPGVYTEELLASAERFGATIFGEFEVKRICPYMRRYRICGSESTITADSLVLAGGARLLPLLRELGIQVPLEIRELNTFLAEKTNEASVLPNYFDRESLEFGRLGQGKHAIVSNFDSHRVVGTYWRPEAKRQSAEDCYAPNRRGVMGQIPGYPRLHLATGWGGTGFKFSLEVGRRLAQEVEKYAV